MTYKTLIMVAASAIRCFADTDVNDELPRVKKYYDALAIKLAPTNVAFSGIYREPLKLRKVIGGFMVNSFNYYGDVLFAKGQFEIWINRKNDRLLCFKNAILLDFIATNAVQNIPTLSVTEATEQARKYLNMFGIEISQAMQISTIEYNRENCQSCWHVCWAPTTNHTMRDTFVTAYQEYVSVCFSEKYGFTGFYWSNDVPSPTSTEVRITQEQAIFKAEKTVPLVQGSPYYLQCRLPGFKSSGVKSAELRAAAPNWLLDPKRAIWIREEPPKETRLCWIVRFTTVDTVKREEGMKPTPPDILIYVDAATGEIVGANFT